MAFILVEHELKPMKLKGNRIVPATISPLRVEELKEGEYVGIVSKQRIRLINFGGFIGYTPQVKEAAYLVKEIPATLDEHACNSNNGELFVSMENTSSVQQVVFDQIIMKSWIYSDFWIPSLFYQNDTLIGEGWFKMIDNFNQAIIMNATTNLETPIKIVASYDSSMFCEGKGISRKECFDYQS